MADNVDHNVSSPPDHALRRNPRLVLASQSPRRIDLLHQLGLRFEVIPGQTIENMDQPGDPAKLVRKLAQDKADEVATRLIEVGSESVVLGADTIVVLDGDVLGKPKSREDVLKTLRRLSGKAHEVYTGVALILLPKKEVVLDHQITKVYFRELREAEMKAYAALDEPMDKAGSYALQGVASAFVERVEGCYTNVIGLPIPLTVSMLRNAGMRVLDLP
jgi:septum formation protein